jgi:hypothetical protein
MTDNDNVIPLFARSAPTQPTPQVNEARAQLALTLSTLPLPTHMQRQDHELFEQCSRLGMWPVPRTRQEAVRDLAWVGPQLLTLFTDCPPEQRPRFERWQRAITRYDSVSAAHWLIRMDLWPVPTKT